MGYIYGIHDPPPIDWLVDQSPEKLCIVFPIAIGHGVDDHSGHDYSQYKNLGIEVIVRVQHGWDGGGCIPEQAYYTDFAQRCANFAAASWGIDIIIIGNEPNHEVERPNAKPISAQNFAWCFVECYEKIKSVANVTVIPGAVAPWYSDAYHPNWVTYWIDVLQTIEILGSCDGLCVHAYTHGADPDLILSQEKMSSMPDYFYHFQHYRQLLEVVPEKFSLLPVYITETDQTDPWLDVNSGWVMEAYSEIDVWNQTHDQQIRRLVLYRWPNLDKWGFEDKHGIQQDFMDSMSYNYQWRNTVSEWNTFYQTSFNEGFTPYQGDGHLTVPNGFVPFYKVDDANNIKRPEYKPKDSTIGQPEVRTAPYAASMGMAFSRHYGTISYQLVGVEAGDAVRASVWAMGVSHHNDGQVGGGLGQTIGLGTQDWEAAQYDEWWSSDVPEWQERYWRQVSVEGIASVDNPWIHLRSDAREPFEAQYSHFDDLLIEVQGGTTPPPPPPNGDLAEQITAVAYVLRQQATILDNIASQVSGGYDPTAVSLVEDAQAKLLDALNRMRS